MRNLLIIMFLTAFTIEIVSQEVWTKYGSNPVLQPGVSGTWDDGVLFGGSVIIEGTTYRMWYSGNDETNFRIGYAYSNDGITWMKDTLNNPVLDLGDPGEWDDNFVYTPNVLFDGTIYHMWYTGNDGLNNEKIGHATSPNGITWTRDIIHNPVLDIGSPGSWDDFIVGGPFVFLENSVLHMWYGGSDGVAFQVGHATSIDGGSTWIKDAGNPVLNVGLSNQWDYPYVQPNSVIYEPLISTYFMFYQGGEFMEWKIGYATSSDIIGPWYKNPVPILESSTSGWDSLFVSSAIVNYDQNIGDYKMWYTGGNAPFTSGSTGLATSPVVPVELTSLTATSQIGKVTLGWSTATEINNLGFEIERKILSNQTNGDWVLIGFREGHGTTAEPKEYSFVDDVNYLQASSLRYRLKQIDFDGSYEYSDEVYVENPAPKNYSLHQNYPNPFNSSTKIKFLIPQISQVQIKVFDVLGNEVATLVNEENEQGVYTINFDANNLTSGVYLYRIQAGSFIDTKKMILMK